MMSHNIWKHRIGDRSILSIVFICAMALALGACVTVPKGEMTQIDSPYLQPQLGEPLSPPGKPGTKIKGTVGAGPGTMELTDAAGDKAFAHVDKDGNIDGFVDKENFKPVTSTLELNDRSKSTWTMQDGKWKEETRTAAALTFSQRLMDTDVILQGGYSYTSGVNATSTGTFPGGAAFLQGSGPMEISGASYNFMLRHPFDRFRPILVGGAPFVFIQGSKFHSLDGTGGAGVSGTGLDRTALQRQISYAFGGGVGYSHPFYCLYGTRGGDECFEVGGFVGGKAVRQQLSASADEAGNVRSFQDSFYQVVPFGGGILTAPLFRGIKLVFTYEVVALNSAALSGTSSFNNDYNYHSSGGLLHNFWGGVSFNLGKILF